MKTFSMRAFTLAVLCATRGEVAAAVQFLVGSGPMPMDVDSDGEVVEVPCASLLEKECNAAAHCQFKGFPIKRCYPLKVRFKKTANYSADQTKERAKQTEMVSDAKADAERQRLPNETLKMVFECAAGRVQVHGLWMERRHLESVHGAVAPGLTMDRRNQAFEEFTAKLEAWEKYRQVPPQVVAVVAWAQEWLWRGSGGDQRAHLKHEWDAHGQFVVHNLDGFHSSENFVQLYLRYMSTFQAAVGKAIGVGESMRQYTDNCQKGRLFPYGRQFFACGYMTPAGWNVHECIG